jgi:hypothetical protein
MLICKEKGESIYLGSIIHSFHKPTKKSKAKKNQHNRKLGLAEKQNHISNLHKKT